MFAVIEDGSRQYRVQEGDRVTIDFRVDAAKGDAIVFDRVMMANAGGGSTIGRPVIQGAQVEGEVVDPLVKGPKLEIQKFRRRKNFRRHTGHRQRYTVVQIKAISVPDLEIPEPAAATESDKA